jgi:hypothetical protein
VNVGDCEALAAIARLVGVTEPPVGVIVTESCVAEVTWLAQASTSVTFAAKLRLFPEVATSHVAAPAVPPHWSGVGFPLRVASVNRIPTSGPG